MCVAYRIWAPAFLCVGHAVSLAAAGESANEAYERGLSQFKEGHFQEAVIGFDEAIRHDPTNKQGYRCRAFAHLFSGNPESAIADFSEAIKLDPVDAVLFYGRGSAYGLLGKKQHAFDDFSEAVRLDPEYGAAYCGRAKTRLKDDVFGAAADTLRAGQLAYRAAGSSRIGGEANRGVASRYARLEAATRVELERFLVYNCWQLLYEEQPLSGGAASEAIREKPADARTYKRLALQHVRKRQVEKCIAALDRAIVLAPKDSEAYKLRGVVHIIKRDLNAAVADLSRAIDLDPTDMDSLTYRASVYGELGDIEKSLCDWEDSTRVMERRAREEARERHRVWDKAMRLMGRKVQEEAREGDRLRRDR
jgi:tetratricopeptide (TPR) repeat protein